MIKKQENKKLNEYLGKKQGTNFPYAKISRFFWLLKNYVIKFAIFFVIIFVLVLGIDLFFRSFTYDNGISNFFHIKNFGASSNIKPNNLPSIYGIITGQVSDYNIQASVTSPSSWYIAIDHLLGYFNLILLAKWFLVIFLTIIIIYLFTIILRKHDGEIFPFLDDRLARRTKRYLTKYLGVIPFWRNEFIFNPVKKEFKSQDEAEVADLIYHMKIGIHTRKDIKGSQYHCKAKISIPYPSFDKQKNIMKIFLNNFEYILSAYIETGRPELTFGEPYWSKNQRFIIFLAVGDVTDEINELRKKSFLRKLARREKKLRKSKHTFLNLLIKIDDWFCSYKYDDDSIYQRYLKRPRQKIKNISSKNIVEKNILGIEIKKSNHILTENEIKNYLLNAVPDQAIYYHDGYFHQIGARFEKGSYLRYQFRSLEQRKKLKPLIFPNSKDYDATHIIPIGFHGSENDPRLLIGWNPKQNRHAIFDFENKVCDINYREPILWYSILKLNNDKTVLWKTNIYNIKGELIISGKWTDYDEFVWLK